MAFDNPGFEDDSGTIIHNNATRFFSTSKQQGITYSWNNISAWTTPPPRGALFKTKNGNQSKQILQNVSGVIRPGELLAVIGSSGAGKSTLFNILAFKDDNLLVSGNRLINGVPANPDNLTAVSAYVQQDDLCIGSLTVREHLIFQALLRMDANISYKERIQRVEEVMLELGLSKCANTKIGTKGRIKGISGGELKRLSFACEILTNPPLMFCDEPTTGLDSHMAQTVVSVLRSLAQKGKSILCTIHTPSSQTFAMFDQLLIMAEGRVAYMGKAKMAIDFFQRNDLSCPRNYNPSDFYVKILAIEAGMEEVCRARVNKVCDAFEQSEEREKLNVLGRASLDNCALMSIPKLVTRKMSPYKASWWTQFRVVLWRSWISNLKDPFFLRLKIMQTVFMNLVVGIIFFGQQFDQAGIQNINGAMYMALITISFDNAYGTIGMFCLELPIFRREHFNGMYRTDVYFLSKMMAEIPFYIFLPILSMSIVYFLVGLQMDVELFCLTAFIYILVVNSAVSVGYMASCMVNSVSVALTVTGIMLSPLVIFGGLYYNAGTIPIYLNWIKYFSWFYYGNEAIMITQWKNVESIPCTIDLATCPANGAEVLASLGFNKDNLTLDICGLLGLVVLFRLLAFVALLLKSNRK